MNESLANKESVEITNEPKLLGLSRPTAGALSGIVLFLFTVAISLITKLEVIAITLLSPGVFTSFMLSPWILSSPFASEITAYSIIFGISVIPPAILGLLLVSKARKERINGIIMLVLYLIIVTVIGLPMYAIYLEW